MSFQGYHFGSRQWRNYDKLDSKYLKDVELIKDEGLKREVGLVNYLTIPKDLLVNVLSKATLHNYVKNTDDRFSQEEVNDLSKYEFELKKYLEMDLYSLQLIIKKFLEGIDDDKIYENFVHILDLTTELAYIDQDSTKSGFSSQKYIDHNHVGEYYFVVTKPIPFSLIMKMQEEIRYRKFRAVKDSMEKADSEYATEELNEFSQEL